MKERELLFSFLKKNENVTISDYDSNKHLMIDSFLASRSEEKEEISEELQKAVPAMKCDVCGCHPSTIYTTQFGTFCKEHVRYI